ncbi:MAG: heparan-alpha-glucosaminide N-acetyltransferase domain-containing protein [bacterium]
MVSQKDRLVFLDLMRAFAVLMMVQGHTVDSLLSDSYRTFDSIFYSGWNLMRGFTAPIFMFTSGVVFTYLLRLRKEPFMQNPRVGKGIRRFLLLVGLGYTLRYPSYRIVDFSIVESQQWKVFFALDALQLIGFGIFFILLLSYIGEKLKIADKYIFPAGALFFFCLMPFMYSINWIEYLPLPFAGYFYTGSGSLFPLFPWAGYVLAGAFFGSLLARNPGSYQSNAFPVKLLLAGIGFIGLSVAIDFLINKMSNLNDYWENGFSLIFLRIGFVLILNGIMSVISFKFSNIPDIFKKIGTNTLLIYVIHLIILYGSAWSPGLFQLYGKNLVPEHVILFAAAMIVLMVFMVVLVERYKSNSKLQKMAAANSFTEA